MSRDTIVLDHIGTLEAAALMRGGRLEDLLVDVDAPRPGTIYRAIADRPIKGQGGMFLRTPDGPAFLRQVKGLAPGQALLVQVTGYAEPGKALPVTTKLLFKSRFAIVTPDAPGLNISRSIRDEARRDALLEIAHGEMGGEAMGLILRSSCDGAEAAEIAEDIRAMADLAAAVMADSEGEAEVLTEGDGPHQLAWRDWTAPADVVTSAGGFEQEGVLDALEVLSGAQAPLSAGASMFIEPTRALVAVDVNTGGDATPAAGLKANLSAARELPRQLRLRGLSGQITLDLAPMAKKDRRQFEQALRAAFKGDAVDTALVGWTPLGHFELQRKRDRAPLETALP
ncbi:ribonuclease E/G [Roseovarius sp. LXJ103]|uniref:ribonuclease E/G n=1 Tax=Roseovarius carneus TaxID=2853164 RepID=UPI000D60EDDD|nr:ribonuclease E/G [Roseovarius carneus]MBZ8118805.1 ribonuclease E/G [Roseovarius carneus]PWE35523.1 ribonuclease G [Pelagicola sp. LXJ1103]